MIIIEKINSNDVYLDYTQFDQKKQTYNTNNHWIDGKPPEDYNEKVALGNASHWIDKFKKYQKIIIYPKEISWLFKAYELGQHTQRFPHFFDDELEDLLKTHERYNKLFRDGKGYFVRCNNVSLKYGKHGTGPYYNIKDIIESTVTTKFGHSPLYPNTTTLEYYLIEWININQDKEFRVFVFNNNITCISQQSTTKPNEIITSEEIIYEFVEVIKKYFEEEIKPKITHLTDYSIDLALLDKNIPYFIEINGFGKEYAAGSSLFHWILDEKKLYNKEGKIYFRYSV